MTNKKGSVITKEKTSFRGPSKRFIAMICIIAASVLFYGFTPSADEESPLTSVTIVDGDKYFEVETKGQTVSDALSLANIFLSEGDTTSKALTANISEGDVITVSRSKTFFLKTGDQTFPITTTEKTVGEALLKDGFQVGKFDEVIPDVDVPVTDGLTVTVTRVYVDVYEVTDDIPYTTKTVENAKKDKSYKKVTQAGKNGSVTRTFKKISKDGAGATATLIGETVTKEPVEEIVEIGTKEPVKTSTSAGETFTVTPPTGMSLTPGVTSDGVPYHAIPTMAQSNSVTTVNGNTAITASGTFTFKKQIPCKATAYEGTSISNGKWAGQTATGRKPVYGVVAVDPSVIPLNTKLYIESADGGKSWVYGFCVAGDTGGAIKGQKIDLCFSTEDQCRKFGRRDAMVYILD